jgi:hypothetical protein
MHAGLLRSLAVALAAMVLGLSAQSRAETAAPPAAAALPGAEWQAIRDVIETQLAALKAGDGTKAFAQAAPGIRRQFGTAGKFLAMVRSSYAALTAARYTEFLEGALVEGLVIQPLRLVGPDDTVLVALYTMQIQPDGSWKIAGCLLAPSTVRAT